MMSSFSKELFYSKILLFGEYSILMGSMGLAIPFAHFSGYLAFINDNSYTDVEFAQRSNQQLRLFCDDMASRKSTENHCAIDVTSFGHDIDKGLYFESSIPQGYGVGSSGALVAAVYQRYGGVDLTQQMDAGEMMQLKEQLANIESWFHGTSSGLDPLICLLNHPFYIENDQAIRPIDLPVLKRGGETNIFLVDTGKAGKTAPLMKQFMAQMEDADFREVVDRELIPVTNRCITLLEKGDGDGFYEALHHLSLLQNKHLPFMIPHNIVPAWKKGLRTRLFSLKLCGSGGGGFVLGFARDLNVAKLELRSMGHELIPVYIG